MVAPSKIVQTDHLSIELSSNARNGMLEAVKNMGVTPKYSKTVTTKDIHGIKNLSFSQISTLDSKGKLSTAYSYDYVCNLDDDYELKITGKYSSGKVTVPVMITHKKQKWSLGCEINLTLNPLELLQNGLYLVGSIPLYGTQVVIKYNIITKDIVVLFRMPLPDGNDEDIKGAAEAGCNLTCLNIDFQREKIYEFVYEYNTIRHYAYNYNTHYNTNTVRNVNTHSEPNVLVQGIGNVVEGVVNVTENVVEGVGNFLGSLFRTTQNERRVQYN